MKKYTLLFCAFILSLFACLLNVSAETKETKYITLTDYVNVRKGPSTSYSVLGLENVGNTFTLKTDKIYENEGGICTSGWYEIDYKGVSGYVCKDYTNLFVVTDNDTGVASTACEKEMEAAGFPSSYWGGLCSLKASHPNWVFKAVNTKLDWSIAVSKFTNCGDAVVYNPKSEWRDESCSYSEGSFKAVNQTAVAYYLDPRNFLTESYIFQFENNNYYNSNSSNINSTIARTVINNTSFYKYHLNLEHDMAEDIAKGGEYYKVNPIHLASRMYQELGTGTSLKNLYQGTFYGDISYAPLIKEQNDHMYDFRGYYNFYNIGVSGSCVKTYGTTYCGLTYAKNHGWNSVYNAVAGGAEFLYNYYVDYGQYTSYFERFNVVPKNSNSLYLHYYMSNLGAPSSESLTSFRAYKAAGILDNNFEFYIPVYLNMNATIVNIDNGAVSDTTPDTSESTMAIATMITSSGYKASGEYLSGIKVGTEVTEIKSNIEAKGGSVTIKNNNSAVATEGKIGTGFQVTIKSSTEEKTYTVVMKGDTSGDGIINAKDLLEVQKNILGTYNLSSANLKAADTSGDGKVNARDLLEVQKTILGSYTIEQ